ncbi:MAG: GAF domain-containing sensor histidine kinase [Actinomycetota bacterium]
MRVLTAPFDALKSGKASPGRPWELLAPACRIVAAQARRIHGGSAGGLVRIVARRSRTLVDASVASVVTPELGDELLVVRVADGEHASELEGMRFPANESISGVVMRSQETLILTDVSADPRVHQPVVKTASVGPAIFAPLAVADRVFGTLLIGRPVEAQPFLDEERSVIELFASQAAIALEHARFQNELHRLAVLEDRERIGRELHDGAIQSLFAAGMKLQSAVSAGGADAWQRVEQAVGDIDHVIGDLRSYIFGLRPGVAARAGTAEALRRLGQELQDSSGVVAVIDIDPEAAARIEPADHVVQFVREALSNVGRHARATTCRLFVGRVGDGVLVEIDDDGDGFHPDDRIGAGQGLPNLHERAAALGARLEIDSGPGRGTTVRATIPG